MPAAIASLDEATEITEVIPRHGSDVSMTLIALPAMRQQSVPQIRCRLAIAADGIYLRKYGKTESKSEALEVTWCSGWRLARQRFGVSGRTANGNDPAGNHPPSAHVRPRGQYRSAAGRRVCASTLDIRFFLKTSAKSIIGAASEPRTHVHHPHPSSRLRRFRTAVASLVTHRLGYRTAIGGAGQAGRRDVFCCQVMEIYGCTEAGSMATRAARRMVINGVSTMASRRRRKKACDLRSVQIILPDAGAAE